MLENLQTNEKTLLIVLVMMMSGVLSRILLSEAPFKWTRFVGELILSAIGAVIIVYAGWMEGLSHTQIVVYGGLASLGGVRLVEWALKLYKKIYSISI